MNKNTWLSVQNYFIYCKDTYRESLFCWISNIKSSFLESFLELYDILNFNAISKKVVQVLLLKSDQYSNSETDAHQEQIYISLCDQNVHQTKLELFVINKDIKDNSNWLMLLENLVNRFSVVFYKDHILILSKSYQEQVVDFFKYNTSLTYISLKDCFITKNTIDAIKLSCIQQLLHLEISSCTIEQNVLTKLTDFLSSISTLLSITLQDNEVSAELIKMISSVIVSNCNLNTLNLRNNQLQNEIIEIVKALEHTRTLKVLNLRENNIPEDAATAICNIINSNTSLRAFYIGNNNLKLSIVVILKFLNKISSLKILDLSDNKIPEEAGEALASVVLHNTGIEELYLHSNNLGIGTLKLAQALQHITTLRILVLDNNNIPQEACDELALAIKSNKHLKSLWLNDNNLRSSANVILKSLTTITTLTVLYLNNNQITEGADEVLASVIMCNTGLEELYLNDNDLNVGILKVAKALQQITTLSILHLGNNNIPQEAYDELALAIISNKHLKKLWLNDNKLYSLVNIILKSLTTITTLTVLNLNNDQITQEADEELASVIMCNTGLEELHLYGNDLGVGTLKLAKALQHITTLRILVLGNNNIPQEACDELALAIKSNKHLKSLLLNDNNLHSSANVILKSLTTITTLTVLNLSNNQITQEADEVLASVIMCNTGLEELHLYGNDLGVGTLKLAKALQHITALRILVLGNNNIPQEACDELALAIKSNKHLKSLWLNDNNLRSSANVILKSLTTITTLTVLYLNNNQITQEADEVLASVIMCNTGLEELHLYGNNLGVGTLKLAKALQHITTLRILALGNNNIPQEACDELALAIKSNKHLKSLLLNDNNLRSSANVILKSLTTITTLTVLYLNNNQITQEADEVLASVIMCNTGLEELHLYGNNLGVGTLKLAKALQHITTLRILVLGNNNIPQEACDELALAIKSNNHLKSLLLNDNNLHSSVNVILKSLTTITTLTVLNLNNNQITQEADEVLASVIICNTELEELHLYGNDLGVGTLKLAKALQHITALRILVLGNNNIPQEACEELALAIKSNKHLKSLWLNDNNLHSSANVILKSLTTITTLTMLYLNNNQLTQEADEVLASVIMCNTGLEELYLNDNDLNVGILKVAKALQQITTLSILNLCNNNIPQEACDELALAIKSNKHLKSLLLNDNNLHSSANVILKSLTTITTLTMLNLNNNQITQEADEVLTSVIMCNTGLEELHLYGNDLGVGTLKLAKALQHITALRILVLGNNNIPQEACDELALAIKSNKHLKSLLLNDNNLHSSAYVILKSLTTITTLTVLNLNNNQITQEADEVLASVIMCNTGLEELHLYGNDLGVGTLKLAKALQHITTLRILALGNNNIPQEACDKLALAIKSNKHLKSLWLNDNNLHSSANVILKSLTTITTLTVLYLNNNEITQEADEVLASVIMCNTGLEELYLNDNDLNVGILKVAKALQQITTLSILNLCNNNIPQEACDELALAIKSNKHLKSLLLNDNNLHSSANVILKSLTTITTLTVLNLNNNQLTQESDEVLASVIMCNTGLEELHLYGNDLGVGTLKLAKALQHITTLRILVLDDNNIPQEACDELALVIKSNKHLKSLWLNDNNLSSSANVILKSLTTITTLTVLNLSNNQITQEADEVLASVIMCNIGLEELYLNDNDLNVGILKVAKALQQITTLSILNLGNNNIPQEACDELALAIISNKHLKKLWLNDNKLYSLVNIILKSLTTITTLKVLYLNNNEITQEADEVLASVIMCNTGLEELYLNDNDLNVGILKVAKALQQITTLSMLNLCNNNIPQEACDELALAIKSNKHLKSLLLNDNNLHSSANVILKSLTTITTLTVLYLNNNQITQEADEVLASVIMCNTGLEELHLYGNDLGVGTLKLAKALQHITALRILVLGNNNIPQEACDELALAIKSNKHLKSLLLNDNNLHSSANVILKSLTTITTLTMLNLNNNQLTQESDEVLASVIMCNTGLEELHLYGNDLGVGTLKLAKALQHITALRILVLGNNNIPQEACDELALAIKSNKHLKSLLLNDNLRSSANIILKSLTTITTLTVLYLNNNQIPQEAGEALASVIVHNTGLKELYLSDNNLGVGTLKVAKALQCITTLRILGLGNNNIPQEACDELALAIKSNKHLKSLLLNDNNLRSSANIILKSLTTITTLTVLYLNNNQITQESDEILASVIMCNTGLEELHLYGNNLGVGTLKLAKALQHITTLRILVLGNNNIPQEACDELALAIKSNKHLKSLLLNDNLCSSANIILKPLTTITTLTVLYLNNNQIPQEAGEALASVIMHNTGLEELYLSDNNLGVGTLKIAKALQCITTLRILGLGNNNIPQEACDELALAIKSNKHLKSLLLNNNNLRSSANVILKSLTTITTLTVVNLNNNQIPQEADEALASVIMHNTGLEELHLYGNNLGVGTLKLAKALQHITTLRILVLDDNNIPQEACDELALAIKSNKHLKSLWLNDNNLSSSANVILKSLTTIITLTVLNLSNNQITQEADEVLASVIMCNTGLEELYLNDNDLNVGILKVAKALQQITTLSILNLGNNNIPQEACDELALAIISNKHLKKLWLNDNKLYSLVNIILKSLTTITTLTVLYLNNNQITQEADEVLASVIMCNTGLEELHLYGNNLGVGTLKLAKALQHITTLRILVLGNNHIPQEACDELALAIKSNKHLKSLLLNDNLCSSANIILKPLTTITTLTVLYLNNNQIPQEAGEALASVIMHNTGLEELYLSDNNLGVGTLKIAKALQCITTLRILGLGNNNIPQEACDELALAIKSNKHLKSLWLNDNNLRSSANVILKSLTTITTLTVVNLNNNQIPQEADEALASVIMHNTGLEELHLYGNNLGVGTLKLAKALQHITTLRILVLDDNNIPQEACDELALAIKSNKHLKSLWLNDNNLSSSANVILKSLTTIITLTVLNLSNNQITQEADEVLASVIMCNTGLEELYLNDNDLNVGILKVAKALQQITTLSILNLGNNNIPQEACDELALAIISNKHLKKLWLNDNKLYSLVNIILKSLTTITTLTVLYLNNNQITQEADEVLASVIMCNTGLEELHLYGNNLGVGTLKLAKALQHITTLRILVLGNNHIPQEACDELALAIKSNKHLKSLLLNDNNLHSSANVILKSLTTITTLTVLNLNNNQITQEADEVLASVIIRNTGLEELHLYGNNLGVGTLKLAKALQHITALRILVLGNNNIPQEACDELALAIKSNKHLKSLLLNDNNLHSSANVILKSLTTITTLTVLNLNNNQITQEADEVLASVIIRNTGLEELHLYGNNLGVGTLKLAKALQHITALRILVLDNNNIPQEACDELALAIKSNKHLKSLWLNDNNLRSSANVILKSLTTIITLTVLYLNNNQITQEADEVLASVIMCNTGLEELHLYGNNLGLGTLKLAKALQHITTLRILVLGNNNIPQEACDELALAIKSNKHLKKLWLNNHNLQYSSLLILQTLSAISTLKVLDIRCNQIGEKGGKVLASVIKSNSTLMELHLGSNNLQGSAISILKALQNISTLELLDLSNNNLLKEFGDELVIAIQSNIYFKHLFLRNNNLQSSIVIILRTLQTISNLNSLSIYGNTITEEAGNMLASVISRNVELQKLELNLLIAPLKVIEALQNLSALQTLVFCTCNISEQIEIKMASVITKNKSLTWLSLPNIKLSQHVILQAMTTISNLRTLWLENNLLSEQMSDDLSLVISTNKSLEKLILLDNMLQNGLIKIVEACNKLSNIKVLQLTHNCIVPSKVVELTSVITQNTSLERVMLGGITLNAAESFHLNVNTVLHKTDITSYCNNTSCVISSNHCTSLEVIYLEMLRKQIDNTTKCLNDVPIHLNAKNFSFVQKIYHYYEHKNNTQLKIQQAKQKLEQIDAQKLISSLCILEKVKVIDLENNNIDEDALFELATVLHSNNVLEQLWLRGNKLNTAGALYILNSLEYLTTLRVLDLSYNNIGSESADGIAAVINNNPLINQLWLDGNDLYCTGTIIICNSLKKIRTLCILSLCNNGITDDVADELSAVITQNVLLEDLLLSNNQLHYTGIKIIAGSLSQLIKLRKLDLFNNSIAKEGASSLAMVLQNSTSLQDLFLSSNNLETNGALEICNALSHINSLHVLTLSNNDISDEVTSQLIEVLNNNHLYALLIGGNCLECGAVKIARVIENDNIAMQLLDFSNNNITEQDKEKIIVVFSKRANFQFYV